MKFKIAASAAAFVAAAYLAPAHAAVPGSYTATFTYPDGSIKSQCFTLTETNTYPGYTSSGTWVDSSTSGVSGTYVVYKKVVHLAGNYGPNFITIDGAFQGNHLINTTFDLFSATQGAFFAAGTFVETTGCP